MAYFWQFSIKRKSIGTREVFERPREEVRDLSEGFGVYLQLQVMHFGRGKLCHYQSLDYVESSRNKLLKLQILVALTKR